ncbi:hypothetical protein C8P64_1493 [Christiangramia gaetbulicola]|uniref:DUF1853 family protein n=1 Tax=Christiangramia gaetbulicola TaxID=703340 RepID=A0A2T6AGL6_9FLAO|nr:DUF1853 family protein [Christiangramia gaetbulicola]PTX42970.1 hypothetical protein C8P64_1493 [Christiangramia gaetbulicola]
MNNLEILDQFKGFLNTKDIFSSQTGAIKQFEFPEIKITDTLLQDLNELDHPRNSVLGKRMESFFENAIKHSSRYELIASNLQIIEDKRTIGELDFLVFDKECSKPLHIELVYKLYVYDPNLSPEINKWIGPNRRDSFPEKLDKLNSRQFPLLYKPEAQNYLQELNLNLDKIEQQLCFKAQLFLPDNSVFHQNPMINLNCITGKWFPLLNFKNMGWENNLFYSPQKKDWSCDPGRNSDWYGYDELINNVEQLFERKKAPLVWMKTKDSFHSFFIVWW